MRISLDAVVVRALSVFPSLAPLATASDLTGKWLFEYEDASIELVDVVDVAGAVYLTINNFPGSPGATIPYSGTLTG